MHPSKERQLARAVPATGMAAAVQAKGAKRLQSLQCVGDTLERETGLMSWAYPGDSTLAAWRRRWHGQVEPLERGD